MKELDDFTVERLQAFIDKPLDNGFTRDEQVALARIVLAAKTAELVAFRVGDRLFSSLYSAGCYSSEMKLTIEPLYLDAQPNSPELPDGWIPCAERMPEVEEEYYLAYSGGITDIAFFFDGRFVDPYITHWQPLPAPPTTEK